ncbi:MAG: hypothetical protein AUH88_02955 [Acidobacteria bacterium 13_1_40CM_4_61_5]|nr:MAG: hypothetical protein AUH88_02955 [Acidobacteria bacterium 13_1_40CM_4_61_5]
MDVVAGAVALVIVLVAAEMEKIQLVNQAVFLEKFDGAVNGDAMHAGVELLCALEDAVGVEVAFGLVHHLKDDTALARQADAAFLQSFQERAGTRRGIDPLARGDPVRSSG